MKTLIFLLIIVLAFNFGEAQIDNDKALHFAGGSLFGLAGAGIAKEISDGNRVWTFVGSVGGALLVGLGKEAIDAGQEGNQWDNGDVFATALGGVAVGFTIDIFTKKKKKPKIAATALSNNYKLVNLQTPGKLLISNTIIHTE